MTKLAELIKLMHADQQLPELVKESNIDDRFNAQMKKVQSALEELKGIVSKMDSPVASQRMQLRHASEDFKRLLDEIE